LGLDFELFWHFKIFFFNLTFDFVPLGFSKKNNLAIDVNSFVYFQMESQAKQKLAQLNKHLLSSSLSSHSEAETDVSKRAKRGGGAYHAIDRFLAVTALIVHCSSFMDTNMAYSLRALCTSTFMASTRFMPMLENALRPDMIAWPYAKYRSIWFFHDFVWANQSGRLTNAQEMSILYDICTTDTDSEDMDMLPMPHLISLTTCLFPNAFSMMHRTFVNIQTLHLEINNNAHTGADITVVNYGDPSNIKQQTIDLSSCCCLRVLELIDNSSHYYLTILGLDTITTLESAELRLFSDKYNSGGATDVCWRTSQTSRHCVSKSRRQLVLSQCFHPITGTFQIWSSCTAGTEREKSLLRCASSASRC